MSTIALIVVCVLLFGGGTWAHARYPGPVVPSAAALILLIILALVLSERWPGL